MSRFSKLLYLAIVVVVLTASNCAKKQPPPPVLGHMTTELITLIREHCGKTYSEETTRGKLPNEIWVPTVLARIDDREITRIECTNSFLRIAYDAETSTLYTLYISNLRLPQVFVWLDALERAGVPSDMVDRMRTNADPKKHGFPGPGPMYKDDLSIDLIHAGTWLLTASVLR